MERISTLGIASGIDLGALVSQLVEAERQSISGPLESQQAIAQGKLSAFSVFSGSLSAFQSVLEPLQSQDGFQGRVVQTSNEEAFTLTADTASAAGVYDIVIDQLATSNKLRSAAFDGPDTVVGTGSLAIASAQGGFSIAIDTENASIEAIRDAINAEPTNEIVRASLVNSDDGTHLILTALESGVAGSISVSGTGGDGGLAQLDYSSGGTQNLVELTAGADASLTIDGLRVTSASNIITDAIDRVSLTLLKADAAATEQATITFDREGARAALGTFVDGYNNMLATLRQQTRFDLETQSSGPLFGESSVRGISSELRELAAARDTQLNAGFQALADIGITSSVSGELSIDAERLDAAFDAGFNDIGRLFAGDDGLASRLNARIESYLDEDGRITAATDTLDAQIERFGERREVIERRVEAFEARTRAQFIALDTLIGELNNTSAFLAQQLAGLPGSGS